MFVAFWLLNSEGIFFKSQKAGKSRASFRTVAWLFEIFPGFLASEFLPVQRRAKNVTNHALNAEARKPESENIFPGFAASELILNR